MCGFRRPVARRTSRLDLDKQLRDKPLPVDGTAVDVIQSPKLEPALHPGCGADLALICPTGCLVVLLSSPICKNIPLRSWPKSNLELPPSRPTQRGVSRSSRTLERDAVDAGSALDEQRLMRTAKSCGPDAPTLASSLRNDPQATVANKPGRRGEHEGNR
jgi:hypothetical protein